MLFRSELYYEDRYHLAAVFGKKDLRSLPDPSDEESRRRSEKSFLAEKFNVSEDHVIFLKQLHGTDSLEVNSSSNALYSGEGDALFTIVPGIVLCIRTADCLPVFVSVNPTDDADDLIPKCAGLIHAGWRGLADGIIESTIERIVDTHFEEKNNTQWNIRIGPGIGFDSYEVGPEVAGRFKEIRRGKDDRSFLDLVTGARNRIGRPGYPGKFQIDELFEGCTFRENERFYSHRKGDAGRNLNVIMLK